ncbi:MAG: hypothetical protein IKZ62_05820 [Prevotella sp.]|nr:hypothetical protein [Prevotella sp.]
MKKKYMNPTTEVIKIEPHKIMAGSPGLNGGEYPGGIILSRENDFLFEE